ncbi:MAG: tRNA threonylcarbamoyladenosine dehydratase [Bacilli bacterium]|nr:tRNA threonylcarbamoyladenosine dehydratase [Bacilli bacterium]
MPKQHRFSRFEKIVGSSHIKLLKNKSVLVLGCGGVGGYTIEALARSGIGTLILVDYDTVELTNINRQIIALESTIGKKKVDVFEQRIHDINPDCKVIPIAEMIDASNMELLFQTPIDYLVDACDMMTTKKMVIVECLKRKIPFISSMGTGNKMDPSLLEIVDLRKTVNDPLARILRKFLKDEKISKKVMVLSSREVPVKTGDRTPGSSAFVPPAAGIMIASYIVREFLK